MTDTSRTDERLDELREHGRKVLARTRGAQQRALAQRCPADARSDEEIRKAYAAAMKDKAQ